MNKNRLKNPKADNIYLKGLYTKLVLNGEVNLPYESLKGLIGPDCAYHLYRVRSPNNGD
jgi:hypothetical protein